MGAEYFNSGQNVLIEEAISGAGVSSILNTSFPYNSFTVQVSPSGGGCTVYASNDSVNWKAWDAGSVTATTIDAFVPVRFIKVTNDTATYTGISIWGVK